MYLRVWFGYLLKMLACLSHLVCVYLQVVTYIGKEGPCQLFRPKAVFYLTFPLPSSTTPKCLRIVGMAHKYPSCYPVTRFAKCMTGIRELHPQKLPTSFFYQPA